MWGLSIEFWQTIVSWANIVALVCGVVTVAALFISGWVSFNVGDIIQRDAESAW
jgi:hypothetical protein